MAGNRQVSNTSRMDSYEISALDPHPRKHVALLDSEMSYVDTGEGMPIVFLHGNPTSSYLWRNDSEEEMNAYRAPFRRPSDRWPTLVWPRELPIGGEPRDVVTIVETYGRWLAKSRIPKLFINADPGALIGSQARQFCRSWPNQREVTVKGIHYVQEDSPREIGVALQEFVRDLNELVEH